MQSPTEGLIRRAPQAAPLMERSGEAYMGSTLQRWSCRRACSSTSVVSNLALPRLNLRLLALLILDQVFARSRFVLLWFALLWFVLLWPKKALFKLAHWPATLARNTGKIRRRSRIVFEL